MPDENWRLTEKEKEDIVAWVKEKWKNFACPYSGDTSWNIGEILVQTTQFTGGSLRIGGPIFPMFILTCDGCGHTVFVNAIQAGILPKPKPESDGGTKKREIRASKKSKEENGNGAN